MELRLKRKCLAASGKLKQILRRKASKNVKRIEGGEKPKKSKGFSRRRPSSMAASAGTATAIYTSVLLDYKAAERHCACYHNSADPANSELFFQFFTAYAAPEKFGSQRGSVLILLARGPPLANINEALRLLKKYSMEINTVCALSMIPEEIPLQRVWEGLQPVFESVKNRATSSNLTLAVTKLAVRSVEDRLQRLKSQYKRIDYGVKCVICNKKISDRHLLHLTLSFIALHPPKQRRRHKRGAWPRGVSPTCFATIAA